MRRAAIVLSVVLLSLAPCSLAAAQGIGPQLPPGLTGGQQTTTAPPTVANPDAGKSPGMSTRQLVLIFGSAMAVLAGIAWIILRDAHRAAPVEEHQATPAERKLSARERQRQQQQKRNKAKAARQQRKRNRPR